MNSIVLKDEKIEKLYKNRLLDIEERGENYSVYDYNGSVVKLKDATLWSDDVGNYIKPQSTEELNCIIC